MKPIYRFFFLLAAFLTLCEAAAGQSGQQYKVRFRAMSWDATVSDLNYANGGKAIPISLLPNVRSQFYDYEGVDPLVFFREITGTDGKPVAQVAASIALNKFHPRTLLMFFSIADSSPKQYQVASVDDSDTAIPPGNFCFLNLSQVPLGIVCGASKGSVPGGQTLTLPAAPADGGGITFMQVDADYPDGHVSHAYSNRLPFSKTARILIFVSQNPTSGQFELKKIGEDIAAIPKESPSRRRE